MGTMLLASAGLTLTGMINAEAQTAPVPKAFAGQHKPRPLPFDPTKLKGISEKLIKSHWENNYSGAVNALNAIEQRLATMLGDKDLPAYVYGDLKREELVRTGSVVLHEYYFANLGGDSKPGGDVLNAIKQEKGKLDIVFANAGGAKFAPLGKITEEHYDALFNSNVKGVLFTVQKALPLLPDGASIILNASVAGSTAPSPEWSVYNATKAAVRSFARSWTTDLKERRIRVNAVSPGYTGTPPWHSREGA